MRHLFPALMAGEPRGGAVVGSADRRAKKRRKRRNDDQRMLDEHGRRFGVAALCMYAAQDDAPDEARARLVRKFLERDQEKLKKVLERYGGYMRDVRDRARGRRGPLQTLARALGAGLHALRALRRDFGVLCCSPRWPRGRRSQVWGRGGLGELANCVSDPAAAVHEEGSEGEPRRRGGGKGVNAGVWAGPGAARSRLRKIRQV